MSITEERLIDEFFKYGSQYYIAGRYGVCAGLIPVGANLHHHGIEMLLKGVLSKSITPNVLRNNYGHRLDKLWKEFKRQGNDTDLDKFDQVIAELSKYEDIRYPDTLLEKGAAMIFDITKEGATQSFISDENVPHYKLCLQDMDELVAKIFEIGNRNVKVYLRFRKDEHALAYMSMNRWWTEESSGTVPSTVPQPQASPEDKNN